MSRSVRIAAATTVGYALGTFPSGAVASRWAGAGGDALGREGTGNPGALNAVHVLGRGWGAAVSAADIGKGALAAAVGRALAGEAGANAAATAAVTGHCHPWGRPGGKGVATSVGQVIGTFPAYLPIDVAVAVSTAALPWFERRTETATLVAAVAWIGCGVAWWRRSWSCGLRRPTSGAVPAAALVSSAVIAGRFRAGSGRVDAFNESAEEKPAS